MLSEQRYKIIMDLLEQEPIVKNNALCKLMSTTRETVRRDLMTLEEKGLLKRIRGGAMKLSKEDAASPSAYEAFHERKKSQVVYKEYIAREAVNLIQDGQVVALDSGTTALLLARELKGKFRSLTVVTNSLAITNELAGAAGIELIVTGGVYKADEEAFLSDFASLIFSKIHVDIFFLTTCGISVEAGVTYQRMDEIPVQTKMMKAADCTIAIVDSSKLGVNSLVRMCGIESIAALVTDVGISAEQKRRFENAGVHVVVAPERSE